ncbi:MAG TPA: hypothetical protein VK679_16950 [Gemmatimonadaceae bacterium]|nr:hypothetical protein [Gemmatimonadaceae bacterium]
MSRVVVAWLMTLMIGCARAGHSTAAGAPPAQTDTFIGTVQLTGPDASVNLLPTSANGGTYGLPIQLAGPPELRSVQGLLVRVVGTQAHDKRWPDRVTVVRFTVIAAKGQPVVDGTLADDAGALYIVTDDGRWHALGRPPAALHAHVGARVWVAGPLDREPIAFGIVE